MEPPIREMSKRRETGTLVKDMAGDVREVGPGWRVGACGPTAMEINHKRSATGD